MGQRINDKGGKIVRIGGYWCRLTYELDVGYGAVLCGRAYECKGR